MLFHHFASLRNFASIGIRTLKKMPKSAKNTTDILASLRAQMRNAELVSTPIDAYIVPTADAHQSEYIAECDERRAYVSGFTGSAGTAIVTTSQAALWTDGRYHLQAEQELDSNWTLMRDGVAGTLTQAEWLRDTLSEGARVGVDPSVYSYAQYRKMETDLSQNGQTLVAIAANLVDSIWTNRPERPHNPLLILTDVETGKSWSAKLDAMGEELVKKKASCLVVAALDDVAWLTNLRGSDIECNPVFFSYGIIRNNESSGKITTQLVLCIDEAQVSDDVRQHLQGEGGRVRIVGYDKVLEELNEAMKDNTGKVWAPQTNTSYAIAGIVNSTRLLTDDSPVARTKCTKTDAEVNGMREAHVQDAIACCIFFAWLEKALREPLADRQRKAAQGEVGYAADGSVTELSVSDKVRSLRASRPGYVGLSFNAISASGSNGAIIHYRPTPETDRAVTTNEIFLLDSGGQYRSGTTDVTRTVHFGTPTDYERRCNTLVLAGHIRLGKAVFPDDLLGHRLDAFARSALWASGLEYLHGTGHGVGHFLNVHEGPCGISSRASASEIGLRPNMIVTDEPGYYEAGRFGIRIESTMLVVEYTFPEGERLGDASMRQKKYVTFESLTLVPIQTKLIDVNYLSKDERDWLNKYHDRCRSILSPILRAENQLDALNWLIAETGKI